MTSSRKYDDVTPRTKYGVTKTKLHERQNEEKHKMTIYVIMKKKYNYKDVITIWTHYCALVKNIFNSDASSADQHLNLLFSPQSKIRFCLERINSNLILANVEEKI